MQRTAGPLDNMHYIGAYPLLDRRGIMHYTAFGQAGAKPSEEGYAK
jgi:hypothetical protein